MKTPWRLRFIRNSVKKSSQYYGSILCPRNVNDPLLYNKTFVLPCSVDVTSSTNPVEIICVYNDESDEKMAQLSIRIQELLELTVRDLRTNFTDLPPHCIKELTDTLQEIQVSTHIFGIFSLHYRW